MLYEVITLTGRFDLHRQGGGGVEHRVFGADLQAACGDLADPRITSYNVCYTKLLRTPEDPVGACMVSSEGTCAAEYKYGTE